PDRGTLDFGVLHPIGFCVDDRWRACRQRRRIGAEAPLVGRFAAKHALEQGGRLDEASGAGETCGFADDVLVEHRRHRVLSASAALIAALAWRAPSTEIEAMVARASSGVTSGAIVARPSTLMCSISPARRTASRSSRLKWRKPRSRLLRAVDCL